MYLAVLKFCLASRFQNVDKCWFIFRFLPKIKLFSSKIVNHLIVFAFTNLSFSLNVIEVRMHRSASVACAQVTTVILHFMMVTYNTGWIVTDLICHLPSIIFLIGVTAVLRICQLVPFRFLVGLHELHQFTLQVITYI